jgi:hypothetical protein
MSAKDPTLATTGSEWAGLIIASIAQTLWSAWIFMLLLGYMHQVYPSIPAVGWWFSVAAIIAGGCIVRDGTFALGWRLNKLGQKLL